MNNNIRKISKINSESLKELEKFIGSTNDPSHFFTMTEINKVGINPQSRYNTPLAVYCYPLNSEYYSKLLKGTLPYVSNKPYVVLFSLSDPVFNMTNYSGIDLERDLKKLKSIIPDFNEKFPQQYIDKIFREAINSTPIGEFWNLTRIISQDAKNWNYLLRKLGYSNFYDPGTGLIYHAEPYQAAILNPSIIKVVDSFYNPNVSDDEVNSLEHISKVDKKILDQRVKQKNKIELKIENIESPKVLDGIAKNSRDPKILNSILYNANTHSKTIEIIFDKLKNDIRISSIAAMLKHKNLSKNILEEIAKNADKYLTNYTITQDFINNPNITDDIILKIFTNSKLNYVKKSVLDNPNLSAELIEKIYNTFGDNDNIKIGIAKNPNCPIDILEKLSNDTSTEIIKSLADNNSLSKELVNKIIKKLSSFDSIDDIFSIANSLLLKNSNKININNLYVLFDIAKNYDVEDDRLLNELLVVPNIPDDLLNQIFEIASGYTLRLIAERTYLSPAIMNALAYSGDIGVRMALTRRKDLTPECFEILSNDLDINIKYKLIYNKNVPISILEKLQNDENKAVSRAAKGVLRMIEEKNKVKEAFNKINLLIKTSKKQLTIEEVKKFSPKKLLSIINKGKELLKKNKVFLEMCKNRKYNPKMIDLIPVKFGDLDVSANTSKAVITLNYAILCDPNPIESVSSYLLHESHHFISMTTSPNGTKSSDDGEYLKNPEEVKSFQYQIKYIDNQFGDAAANKYVNQLLDHHDVKNKKRKTIKKELLKKVDDE